MEDFPTLKSNSGAKSSSASENSDKDNTTYFPTLKRNSGVKSGSTSENSDKGNMEDFLTLKRNSGVKSSSTSENSDKGNTEDSSDESVIDLMDTSIPLKDRIVSFLYHSKYPFPSRWIGEKIGATKKEVNSMIYKNIDKFEKIECIPPLWKLRND
uniref:Uncharacterized protein n=1 Tax=Pithovirus LCPAC101 TaxID=2506586 RepID=A0A481Z4P7_9VIRU|nr:MAG: hypothetical protein LCPAC101_03130 [Pithovirus LCPAC101]